MMKKIKNIAMLLVGNMMIAFALSTLVLENGIIAGGVSGIGIICNHYFNLPLSVVVAITNVVLFTLGLVFLGKVFALSTIISTFTFPLFLETFENLSVIHNYLNDPLLASVLAGCLIGVGIGLVIKANASTGGVDIIALVVNKKTGLPVHIVLNILDFSILIGQFTFHDTTHVIYGIVVVMITSLMLNKTLTMGQSLVQVLVISDLYEDIQNMILKDIDAGLTLIDSQSGYRKTKFPLLLTVLPYNKLPLIKQKINELDNQAFVVVSHVDQVGGRGFTFDAR